MVNQELGFGFRDRWATARGVGGVARYFPLALSLLAVRSPALFENMASARPRTVMFSGHYSGTAALLIHNGAVTVGPKTARTASP